MKEIKITEKRLRELEDAEAKLDALEAGGVDNWEWYSESLKEYFKEKEYEEFIGELIEGISEIVAVEAYEPAGNGAGYAIKEDGINQIESLIRDFYKKSRENEEEE